MRRIQVFIASAVKAPGDSSDAARNHSERTKQKNLISRAVMLCHPLGFLFT